MLSDDFTLRASALRRLKADLFGEEWLYLIRKPDRTLDEQNLRDRLKHILIASGWQEDLLDRLATEYKVMPKGPEKA